MDANESLHRQGNSAALFAHLSAFSFPRPLCSGAQHPYHARVRNIRIHTYYLPHFCHCVVVWFREGPHQLIRSASLLVIARHTFRGEKKGKVLGGERGGNHDPRLALGLLQVLHMFFFSLSFPSSLHCSPLVFSLSSSPLITHPTHPLFSIAPGFFPNSFRRTLTLCSLAPPPPCPLASSLSHPRTHTRSVRRYAPPNG